MSNEYIWSLSVDGTDQPWKCVVTENECITYEGEEQTHRMTIPNHDKGRIQMDKVISIYGMDCQFQLENEIPYIHVGGKWTMSETTYIARRDKMLKNQKLSGWIQVGFALILCVAGLIYWLVNGALGQMWFLFVAGSVLALTGGMQIYNARKAEKEPYEV